LRIVITAANVALTFPTRAVLDSIQLLRRLAQQAVRPGLEPGESRHRDLSEWRSPLSLHQHIPHQPQDFAVR